MLTAVLILEIHQNYLKVKAVEVGKRSQFPDQLKSFIFLFVISLTEMKNNVDKIPCGQMSHISFPIHYITLMEIDMWLNEPSPKRTKQQFKSIKYTFDYVKYNAQV